MAILVSSPSRWMVDSPMSEMSSSAAGRVMLTPLLWANCCTCCGSSRAPSGLQSMTAFLSTLAIALYRRVFFASFSAMSARTVVSLGLSRYETMASCAAFLRRSADWMTTRRFSLMNGIVLQAAVSSSGASDPPSSTSLLKSRSPSFAMRSLRRP